MAKKNKPAIRYELQTNSKGSIVGSDTTNGVIRIAAHMYQVPSTSSKIAYEVYVASLIPFTVYRCRCHAFLIQGECKHGPLAVEFEAHLEKRYPKEMLEEHRRRLAAYRKT